MNQITQDQLNEIVRLHGMWLRGEEGGKRADLSDSDLRGSDLRGSDLSGSDLSDSDLRDSNLRGSNLRGSDLSGSNLSDSNLRGSNLSDSDLSDSNLRGSNLSDSDLSDSNLRGCGGNLVNIRSIWLEQYQVTYTADVMQIGCQRHAIADWWGFTDAQIQNMDGTRALEWWVKFKPLLQQIIAMCPAEPTGYVAPAAEVAA